MKRPADGPQPTHFAVRPPTPQELSVSLQTIFPEFSSEDVLHDVGTSDYGLHTVMRNFTEYFGAEGSTASERQLRALGGLIDEAVAVDDQLENAVSTCMLEHLRQIKAYKILSPYLSRKAKQRTHA
ncbi:MAG TPA: hypothetical protein VHQ22_08705 [Terriglobales bacterium]|jgi:hypothetical protein|nr:hypothetical protein [Terriglobales bacterium]